MEALSDIGLKYLLSPLTSLLEAHWIVLKKFNQFDRKDLRTVKTCTLQHGAVHSEKNASNTLYRQSNIHRFNLL